MISVEYRSVRSLFVLTLVAVMCSCVSSYAQATLGDIRGVTRNSKGQPLSNVQIVVNPVGTGGFNTGKVVAGSVTATSGSDGAFVVQNLNPGQYQLLAQKAGFEPSKPSSVDVAAGESRRSDIVLAANEMPDVSAHGVGSINPDTPSRSTLAADPEIPPAVAKELQSMRDLIGQLQAELNSRKASEQPSTATEENLAKASEREPALLAASRGLSTAPSSEVPAIGIPAVQQGLAAAPAAPPAVDTVTPFAYADWTWLNGNPRNKDAVWDSKFFTPEVRFDTHFMTDFNQPRDHTMGGATESFRSGEVQVEQISFGGDFHWQNVRGRVLTMGGLFATTTPRNDGSAGVGQWDVRNAYKYFSEAYGGYHFDVNHGLNVDAGIFVSYIGLFSYYNFDNWTYQPSFVSSNTPWFFNGVRIQWFPTNKLKIEPWIINGWQSYNRFNGHHGFGGQILYRPKEWLSLVFNNYGNGTDTLGNPNRVRLHTDDSIEIKYYDKPDNRLDKMAFSFTADVGCEYGGGVSCRHDTANGPKQSFAGWMLYNRFWFYKDQLAVTLGGGKMDNQGRYLTLLPPINGADAISGSPYFTANPGDPSKMWDATVNLQWMPRQYVTWWLETGYRHSNVPYWTGRGGITPPGGNNGAPGQFACSGGAPSGTNDLATAYTNCGGPGSVWFPDLRKGQATVSAGVMVKF